MTRLDNTMRTVAAYVNECVGEVTTTDEGILRFPFGSTQISVSGSAGPSQQTTFVEIRSYVADSVPVTDELLRWLPSTSNGLALGHVTLEFAADPGFATLEVRHTLLGDYLELDEMRLALSLVATEADRLDDVVIATFGGKRFADRDVV